MIRLLCLCSILCVVLAQKSPSPANSSFSARFDNVNIDEILNSRRLISRYVICLVENKQCTPEGVELRRVLPEVIDNHCAKCTPKQREAVKKAINKFEKDYPTEWKKLLGKWDPSGQHLKIFKAQNP